MNHQSVDTQVTHWRPPLLKLTLLPNPDVEDGEAQACFVAPELIQSIAVRVMSWATAATYGQRERAYHPARPCTEVVCGSLMLLVTESPETVAMLRDRALGHEPLAPKAVV